MSSVPAGKRIWICPECGNEVLLSMTQLDPIACEVCLGKVKGKPHNDQSVAQATPGPLRVWATLPETTKLAIAAFAFVAGLLLGLTAGFVAGRASAPRVTETTRAQKEIPAEKEVEKEEERPDPPGPGYKWVRGRERKDGTRGSGHWAKDPFYKGDEASNPNKK